MSLSIYEPFTVMPLQARTATTDGTPQRMLGATGLLLIPYVSAAGTSTLTLAISAYEPLSDFWGQFNANVTITTTGRTHWWIGPGFVSQPAGEAAVTLSAALKQVVGVQVPERWRISVVKGDASSWTFGVSGQRLR